MAAWILFSLGAAVLFTADNEAIAIITQEKGIHCILYFASGSVITSIIYQLVQSYRNSKGYNRQHRVVFWNDQKLIIDGKVDWRNVVGYIAFCLNYFLMQNMAFATIWFAAISNLNIGVILVLWGITPLL